MTSRTEPCIESKSNNPGAGERDHAARPRRQTLVATLLAPFRELAIDRAIAERAGRVRGELGVALRDALIAATALEHGLALATRNLRDFEHVPKLRLVRATR
jgi:predicted nucleic acid-binding protein